MMDESERRTLLASVNADLARLAGEIAELQRIKAYLSGAVTPAATTGSLLAARPPSAESSVGTVVVPSLWEPAPRPARHWRELIERAIRDLGEKGSIRAPELAELLVARYGVGSVEGRGLEKKLYTVMRRRRDIFVNLGGGRWSLVEYWPNLQRPRVVEPHLDDAGAAELDEDSDTEEVKP